MKAVVYHGKANLSVDEVEDPHLVDPTDAVIKVTSAAICGSDLHLYGGFIPGMVDGDIMGHEFMGEVVALGEKVTHVKVGDRVVVPFNMGCGDCFFCVRDMWSLCDRSNRNKEIAEKMFGVSPSGLFGYTHIFGGYPGGQAQFVRVPFAHAGLFKVPDTMTDEQALFLGDIFPTGYMAAENCAIEKGDTVAIWGAGPVGQFAAKSAQLLGAEKIIVIDRFPERLAMAAAETGAITINYEEDNVPDRLKSLTAGRGPDKCIDSVGMEAHTDGLVGAYDKIKQAVRLETDRAVALREIIYACRKGGVISVPGVYAGLVDKFPMGILMNKGLRMATGQTHTHKYVSKLMEFVKNGAVDPTYVITHTLPLKDAVKGYEMFRNKDDNCVKVVLKPWA